MWTYVTADLAGRDRYARCQRSAGPDPEWRFRSDHARSDGNAALARDHYRKALEAGPRKPEILLHAAVIDQELDDYDTSVRLLDEALAADPGLENAYYYRARASALAAIDIERGLECAEYYVEHCEECDDSDRGYGWWRLATLRRRNGEVDAAAAAYREALRLNPELDGARQALEALER